MYVASETGAGSELTSLLRSEQARAEALVNRIRGAVVGVLALAALAYASRIPRQLVLLNFGVLLPVLVWTIWLGWRLRRTGGYQSWMAWISPTVDVAALTFLQAGYGILGPPGLAVHAPLFLAYFAVLAARPLAGSARAAALTTALTTLAYAALSAAFLTSGHLRLLPSPVDVGSIDSVSLLDECTKVILLFVVGTIATYATAWHAGILRRALAAQVQRSAEERELAQRLQEADKLSAVGTIAAAAVHEVKNPLTTINLEAQMLLRTNLEADQRHEVEVIFSETRRAVSFVNDLLRVTRVANADVVGPVSLPSTIDAALAAASPLLRDQHVTVRRLIEIDDEHENLLHGSAAALERAILNLIVNGVQAMEEQADDRELELSVSGGHRSGALTLVVRDNGHGFTSESAARAFERFFTTKPPGKGTGLGLWIVRETMEAYGGSVSVDPLAGRGARIRLTFPLTQVSVRAAGVASDEKAAAVS